MSEGPRFDPTINLGHVITAVTFFIMIGGSWYVTDYRLGSIEKQMATLSSVVIDNARLQERLNEHGRRIDRLEKPR